uniref:Phosphatidylinositol-specific phospholipase C X domain-containing protein n=1 Tax=Alexandrium monilatum TaxID=311494 RepID=A0A7S4UBU7_9DINO
MCRGLEEQQPLLQRHGRVRGGICEGANASSVGVWQPIPEGPNLSGWMGDLLLDSLPLGCVSMPGTHNSASFAMSTRRLPSLVVAGGRCQSWDLGTQLRRGVRFLDLRVRPSGALCHGPVDCGVTLQDSLEVCSAFLKKHPREIILARVKDEACSSASALGVRALMRSMARKHPVYLEDRLPLVGQVRGRIVVLSEWTQGGQSSASGLRWGDESMCIQDEYWHFSRREKWRVVEQELLRSEASPGSLTVHFTSATHLPRKVPLGFAGFVNCRLAAHLRASPRPQFVGVIAMDFPSASLCELIVRRNQLALDPCRTVHGLAAIGADGRDELVTLQCELMVAAGRADAAALVHCDAEEHQGRVRQLARHLVRLAVGRVVAELCEPAVDEGLLPGLVVPAAAAAAPGAATTSRAPCGAQQRPAARRGLVQRLGSSFFCRCARA